MSESTGINPLLSGLNPSYSTVTEAKKKANGNEMGKDDFLKLLITQLKTQDPLDPAKPEEFASSLAQFTSLEQLIGINTKLDGSSGQGGLSSLASYLGQEVFVDATSISVNKDTSGFISFKLPADTSGAAIEVTDEAGTVVKRHEISETGAGEYRLPVRDLGLTDGTYSVRVATTSSSGIKNDIPAQLGGVVTGFIPGDKPQLMIGEREVDPGSIRQVRLREAAAA